MKRVLWEDKCRECVAKKVLSVAYVERECEAGLCAFHCGCCGGQKTELGVADAQLPGVTAWRLPGLQREKEEKVVRELALWTPNQLALLDHYIKHHSSPATLDLDEAAASVGDKTSTQCARLLKLIELAVPLEANADEADGKDEAEEVVHEEEEQEEQEETGINSLLDGRTNTSFYVAAIKAFLHDVVSQCNKRSVSGHDIREILKDLNKAQ
jgi:hypothetical protein